MSSFTVDQPHALGVEVAKQRLGHFAEDLKKYGMSLAWSGTEAELKGTGASGNVKVTSTNVQVTVKLGMLAKAAGIKADRVQESIQKRLRAALDGSSA